MLLGEAPVTFYDGRQMAVNRIVSIAETVYILTAVLSVHWRTGLLPAIGFLLMAYLPARWLRQNIRYYQVAWWTTILLCLLPLIPGIQLDYRHSLFVAGWWFMLFLAAIPQEPRGKRKDWKRVWEKIARKWAVGIPITSRPG